MDVDEEGKLGPDVLNQATWVLQNAYRCASRPNVLLSLTSSTLSTTALAATALAYRLSQPKMEALSNNKTKRLKFGVSVNLVRSPNCHIMFLKEKMVKDFSFLNAAFLLEEAFIPSTLEVAFKAFVNENLSAIDSFFGLGSVELKVLLIASHSVSPLTHLRMCVAYSHQSITVSFSTALRFSVALRANTKQREQLGAFAPGD